MDLEDSSSPVPAEPIDDLLSLIGKGDMMGWWPEILPVLEIALNSTVTPQSGVTSFREVPTIRRFVLATQGSVEALHPQLAEKLYEEMFARNLVPFFREYLVFVHKATGRVLLWQPLSTESYRPLRERLGQAVESFEPITISRLLEMVTGDSSLSLDIPPTPSKTPPRAD